jgi:hypothetical protein
MSPADFFQAIQDTDFFTAIRESELAYPIIMSLHLSSIAVFGGMILMTDLRLLGLALKGMSITEVVGQFRRFKQVGFVIMISCGIMLGGAKIATYYDNPYFLTKITLLCLVGVHALVFRKGVYRNTEALDKAPEMPRVAKVAACLSLTLWLGIMCCGRLIAYFDRPVPKAPKMASAIVGTFAPGSRG